MSKSGATEQAQGTERDSTYPRAIIHKRILEVAEAQPEASMDEIAAEVSAATPMLVDQVLEEYGDPGDDAEDTVSTTATGEATPADEAVDAESMTDEAATSGQASEPDESHGSPDESAVGDHWSRTDESTEVAPLPEPDTVTEKQLETLRAIRERPTATQAALADQLGVASATISQRVNGIDGFDWATRRAFVERFFAQDGIRSSEAATVDEQAAATSSGADEGDAAADDAAAEATETDTTDKTAKACDAVGRASGSAVRSDGGDVSAEPADRDATPREESDRTPSAERAATPNAHADNHDRGPNHASTAPTEAARATSVAALTDRVAELTARLETLEEQGGRGRDHTVDPALAHKVLRACFRADDISTDEEIELVDGILAADNAAVSRPVETSDTEPSSAD
ncbi:winged helix-turn-helix domain-containing protein [Natrinema sp. 1APR25-10V2]|uniref:winged helix-turn-helix domain-containing protein n=1 Tax=Natrinema sp. 1APR25-10V2 TaxID=2951081 RepID=UPI00287685FF|nr:winged helix-turn-helix domain-containing protein [Natrinema sp. 1APR25-10V2]MDS0475725.1 winged helix-turn-helix domain-containing protein [Natrinema sp. 1APR25-10V2]